MTPPNTDTKQVGARIPVEMYEWLRRRAFEDRTSINSLIIQAVEQLRRKLEPESK